MHVDAAEGNETTAHIDTRPSFETDGENRDVRRIGAGAWIIS